MNEQGSYLVKDEPFYATLLSSVGSNVTVHSGRTKHTDKLHIWTATSGREGWLVAENCPDDGTLPTGGFIIFAGTVIKKVVVDLFGTHIYLDS